MEDLLVKKVIVTEPGTGKVIFREGDREAAMYHLISGRVGIYSRYGRPNQKQLAVICADDPAPYFGEMGLIDYAARSATAVALEDCRLGYITSDTLLFYLRKHPELVMDMLRRMSGRLRTLTNEYMDACHVIARQKAAHSDAPKADSEWTKTLKKYTAVFDDPPTEAEIAALSVRSSENDDPRPEFDREMLKNTEGPAVMEARVVPAGMVIFDEGDIEACMYELMRGSVDIYADYGLPTQKKLTTASWEKNRFFGEMGLIDSAPRSATAVAAEDCTLLTIDEGNLENYFVDDPEKLFAIMRQLSGRIRALTHDYMEAVKTIAENERYEQRGESKPEWLMKNLKIFADVWKGLSSASGSRL